MGIRNHNRLLIVFLVTTMLLSSVGTALAADGFGDTENKGSSHTGSSLNIKADLNEYIDTLDPMMQEPAHWVVDNFFLIVVIAMVLLVWYHGAEEASSKRSGSVAGQAKAQNSQERVAKTFIWSIVLSIMILFFAAKYML